ncbi:ATP-dependent nuclease [Terasakiella pusilla]|uniref:ATP-dependent nuclease n=1 Tax=Terasakiella pusilla TaxID=64973 RepID=UPI003AA84556
MELVNFSVRNYRSITKAHKVAVSDTTILIGRNNEGKSNLLKALDVGMTSLKQHALLKKYGRRPPISYRSRDEKFYNWERDFPIALQSRKRSGTQTVIRLEFLLNDLEIHEFKKEIKSNLNGTLPIIVRIGKDSIPTIRVSKTGRGSKALNSKSGEIAEFIANKILFNYIPAIRTDQEALEVVAQMLSQHLDILEEDPQYVAALDTIKKLQQPILQKLAEQIREPLEEFLPGIKDVTIEIGDDKRRRTYRRDFDIIINDGTATNLAFKGDGVKSLAALGLLKDRVKKEGASIIAIEEPESHLHPAAIHQLNNVIKTLGEENQVILTTHNPLFVDRQEIKSNIIVDAGKASPAKNVKSIRDLLGIKASDNLTNASYVLVVEGDDDVIALTSILRHASGKIKKAIDSNMLIIEPIGGAGNLPYKLTLLKNSLCVYHVYLDNDDAGRKAYSSAEKSDLIDVKDVTFSICNGSPNSEFEDCLDPKVYEQRIQDEFGVNLNCQDFRGNKIWGDRIKATFLNQGKGWNGGLEARVKFAIADCVKRDPAQALNLHKKNSIDALISSLNNMISDS